jgi:NhaP-type Na+/H+ or K+/H+ antiporter
MSDSVGLARFARGVLTLGLLAAVASGCDAKHHRTTTAAAQLQRGYSVRQVTAAFAREGLSLTVLARDQGSVFLTAAPSLSPGPQNFTDSINVHVRPRLQHRGRILVLVLGGHQLLWARNVTVDFDPTSPWAMKARSAVARLRRTPTRRT